MNATAAAVHRSLDRSRLDAVLGDGPLAQALAAGSFLAMLLGAIGTIRTGRWWFRVLLTAGALVWPLPSHPLQGPVIVSISFSHGIHAADLLSVLGLATAFTPWRRLREPSRQRD